MPATICMFLHRKGIFLSSHPALRLQANVLTKNQQQSKRQITDKWKRPAKILRSRRDTYALIETSLSLQNQHDLDLAVVIV